MKKQTLALITAALMLAGMVSGCGNSDTTGGNSSSGATEPSKSDSASTNESDTENNIPAAEAGAVSLPLTEEPVTLTMWCPMNADLSNVVDSLADNLCFIELEKRTGVHIEFSLPAVGQEATNYNLMIASGDLCDIIYNSTGTYYYPDGLDAAVNDGYFLDLTDLIEQYAPNYQAKRTSSDFLSKASMTDGGKLAAIYQIPTEEQGPFAGYYVRRDWLEQCGLDLPVTYDDWEEMLVAFKDQIGASAPLSLGPNGFDPFNNALSAGYDVSFGFYQVDNTVKYGPIEDGWKDYLTMMNRWYEKGLIDPDYMSGTSIFADTSMVTSNKTGAFPSLYTLIGMYEAMNTDQPECDIYPVPAPVQEEGDTAKIRAGNFKIGVYFTISADCEYPELAVQWIDYQYSDEGALLDNYGIEGDTFTYDANGKPQFTEKVTASPEGYSFAQAMAYYTMPPSRVCLQDWTRELASVPEKDLVSYDIWAQCTDEHTIPTGVSMTSEENTEYAKIIADIQSLVQEKTNLFITGELNLDADYDEFVSQIKSMNIDRALEIYQAALDRFNER